MGQCTITIVDCTMLLVVEVLYKRNNDYYLPPEERRINKKKRYKQGCCSLHQVKQVTTGTVLVV